MHLERKEKMDLRNHKPDPWVIAAILFWLLMIAVIIIS